jgi:hypothetical protein
MFYFTSFSRFAYFTSLTRHLAPPVLNLFT